jgi:hypothetical protein
VSNSFLRAGSKTLTPTGGGPNLGCVGDSDDILERWVGRVARLNLDRSALERGDLDDVAARPTSSTTASTTRCGS